MDQSAPATKEDIASLEVAVTGLFTDVVKKLDRMEETLDEHSATLAEH